SIFEVFIRRGDHTGTAAQQSVETNLRISVSVTAGDKNTSTAAASSLLVHSTTTALLVHLHVMERRLILQDDLSDGYTSENAIIRDLELSENYSEDLNTLSPVRTTKRSPTPIIVRRKGRRSKVPIDDSFVEIKVQAVVDLLKASPFLKDHSLEPTIGSNDGIKLLGGCMPSYLFTHPRVTSKSVYWVLIDDVRMKCRICGSVKSTQERA
ncbi:11949_t:CDS:2, partial [Acaulospora colombiana]